MQDRVQGEFTPTRPHRIPGGPRAGTEECKPLHTSTSSPAWVDSLPRQTPTHPHGFSGAVGKLLLELTHLGNVCMIDACSD